MKPEKRDADIKRRLTEEIPEGMKLIGEWNDLGGGRLFALVEVADTKAIGACSSLWNDLGNVELEPVMELFKR